MEYLCLNCENLFELPEEWYEQMSCPFCNDQVVLDSKTYISCRRCSIKYLSSFNECIECSFIEIPNYKESYTSESRLIHNTKNLYNPNYIYISDEAGYINSINYLNHLNIIACDTETNGLNVFTSELFLIQLGNEEIIFIFNFNWHNRLKQERFWQDSTKIFLLHNAKFDYKVLKYNLNIEIPNIFDTMIAERLLTCGVIRENSLKAVTKKYLAMNLDKEIVLDFITMTKKTFHSLVTKEHLAYSARDVAVLPLIYRLQKTLIRNENLDNIAELEFQSIIPISEIELAGIYVDVNKWQKIIEHNEEERNKVKSEIYTLIKKNSLLSKKPLNKDTGTADSNNLFNSIDAKNNSEVEINLNSTQALKKVFLEFGIVIEKTGESTLAELKHPFAELLIQYRGYEKQLSAFGKSFIALVRKETGRVHPSFNQIGADTGRMSCNNPNMQQIPAVEEYRSCFSAPPGKKIVTCDYSQQELRLLASLSGDPKFIKMYEDGVDLHSATASLMYNIPIDQIPKDKRSAAKTINFGLAYGRGSKALATFLGISEEEGKEMIKIYFSQFSYIGDWLNNAAKFAQENGYSETLFGRKRYYKLPSSLSPDYNSQLARIGRQGKNSPIQGSGVDMVKLALIKIRNRLMEEKLDAFLINTVHDEIVIESSVKDAERSYEIIEECMIDAGRTIVKNVPILAEAAISDFWKH